MINFPGDVIDLTSLDYLENLDDKAVTKKDSEREELSQILQQKGYQGLDNLTMEELEELKQHDESCNLSTSEALQETLSLSYNSIRSSLVNSVATDVLLKSDSYSWKDLFKDISEANALPSSVSSGVVSIAIEELKDAVAVDETDLVSVITGHLLEKNVMSAEQLSELGQEYFNYVRKVIPDIQKFIRKVRVASGIKQLKKEGTTEYLLSKDAKLMKEMQQHHLSPIQQIQEHAGKKSCVCPKCANNVTLNNLGVTYLIFATEKGHRSFEDTDKNTVAILPNVNYCSCGEGFVYCLYDLYNLNTAVKLKMKKSANKFAQEALQFGKGTACARTEIPLSFFKDNISYLFYDEKISTGDNHTEAALGTEQKSEQDELTDVLASIKVDSVEMEEASKRFYQRLISKGIVPLEEKKEVDLSKAEITNSLDAVVLRSSSHLSYHELAVVIATHLSKNYNVLKRQALFSLVFSLKESMLIEHVVNKQHLWDKEIELKACNALPKGSAASLNSVQRTEVSLLFSKYSNADLTIEEKLQFLRDKVAQLQEEIQLIKQHTVLFYNALRQNKDMLSFTRIVNLNQYKLNEILGVLDKDVIELFDEVTDRMIINNYAEKYFTIYTSYNIFNTSLLSNTINKCSDNAKVSNSLVNAFNKVVEKATDVDTAVTVDVETEFAKVAELSTKSLEPLQELYKAFQACDFYTFIQAVSKLDDISSSIISNNFKGELHKLFNQAQEDRELISQTDRLHFYLKDFNDEEFDSMSMKAQTMLESLNFGLYVPKRKASENINRYIERYYDLQQQGSLYKVDCYDYSKAFMKYASFFGLIFLCNSVTSLEYSSYTRASFISVLCEIVVNGASRTFGNYLFAINEEVLNRVCYDKESLFNIHADNRNERSIYSMLNGHYSNCMTAIAEENANNYFEKTVSSTDAFDSYLETFTLKDFLRSIMSKPFEELALQEAKYQAVKQNGSAGNIDVSDINGEEVLETIVNEIEYYAEIQVDKETV